MDFHWGQALTSDATISPTPPGAFGRFRVVHQLGAGVHGPVFLGVDPEGDRQVAIKTFPLDIIPERAAELAAAFERLAAAGLDHPSIVAPLAAGAEGSTVYLVQDYVLAESVDAAIRQYGPAPVPDALRLVGQLAGAIDFAAAAGVHHGALHPRDVLVAPNDVRLTGLGIAQALEQAGVRVAPRRPYSAPERHRHAEWGVPADVFSLAAVAFELLTGRRPGSAEALAADTRTIPSPDAAALAEVFARALSPRAQDRYQTALAFAAALRHALTGEPIDRPDVAPLKPAVAVPAAPEPEPPAIEPARAEAVTAEEPPAEELKADELKAEEPPAGPAPAEAVPAETGPIGSSRHEPVQAPPGPIEPAPTPAEPEPFQVQPAELAPSPAFLAFEEAEAPLRGTAADEHDLRSPLPDWEAEPAGEAPPPADEFRRPEDEAPAPDDTAPFIEGPRRDETFAEVPAEGAALPGPRELGGEGPLPLLPLEAEPERRDAALLPLDAEPEWRAPDAPPVQPEPERGATAAVPVEPEPEWRSPAVPPAPPPADERVREEPPAPPRVFVPPPSITPGGLRRQRFPLSSLLAMLLLGIVAGFVGGYFLGRAEPPAPANGVTAPAAGQTPAAPQEAERPPAGARPSGGDATSSKAPAPAAAAPSRATETPGAAQPPAAAARRPAAAQQPRASASKPAPSGPSTAPRDQGRVEAPVMVVSRPPGALVRLDGRAVGKTPIRLPAVSAGSHVIRLELTGYAPWTAGIQVVSGEENRVTASLDRRPGGME